MTRQAPQDRMRLQKFLSDAGVVSRRYAEEWIREGRVLVNDKVVDTLPAFVHPKKDRVVVDGTPVKLKPPEYFIIHKPKNVVCTNRDPAGRVRAVDLLPPLPVKLFPVGRLDADSTGLLLLTNDGDLAQRIAHPRYGMAKTYRAEVRGRVPGDLPAKMRAGVHLAEGKAVASSVDIVSTSKERSTLAITLREGRNRQVRRMLAKLGFPVRKLKRVQIGPISLRKLPVGAARRLTAKEVRLLQEEAERAGQSPGQPRRRRTTPKPAQKASKKKTGRTSSDGPGDEPPPRRLIT